MGFLSGHNPTAHTMPTPNSHADPSPAQPPIRERYEPQGNGQGYQNASMGSQYASQGPPASYQQQQPQEQHGKHGKLGKEETDKKGGKKKKLGVLGAAADVAGALIGG